MTSTTATLQSLIVSAHRLTRVAAQSTGDRTSPAVWRTLSILENEGPMRLGELAVASRVAQPTMSKLIQGLAADEWIRRIADVEDSRSWLIAPTEKGRAALADWLAKVTAAAEELFAGVGADEWAVLAQAAAVLDRELDSSREVA